MNNLQNIAADKALSAIYAYARHTDSYSLHERDDARREELERAIQHLLCDLRHLCEREGISFNAVNTEANKHHREEVE